MKKLVAVIMIVVMSLSVVNADISGFTKSIVKSGIKEWKKDINKYNAGKEKFIEYERERVDKWNRWGNDILEKNKKGIKYDKATIDKAKRAVEQKERTYDEYLQEKVIKQKKKAYGDMLRYRNEFGLWRRFGSKLFGEWVKYIGNKKYPNHTFSITGWIGEKLKSPMKKKTNINKATATNEEIPEQFDTNIDMPVELLSEAEVDVYFDALFPNELVYSELWSKEEKIQIIKKDYALAVPYEVYFEGIVEASEEQVKVMYYNLKVKSEAGESQRETLLRLFVWDYIRRNENILMKIYRDVGISAQEAHNMLNGNTPVPTPTPMPITGGF